MKIGDKVKATMNGTDWFEGELVEEVDLFVPYRIRLESGEVRYFAHAENA